MFGGVGSPAMTAAAKENGRTTGRVGQVQAAHAHQSGGAQVRREVRDHPVGIEADIPVTPGNGFNLPTDQVLHGPTAASTIWTRTGSLIRAGSISAVYMVLMVDPPLTSTVCLPLFLPDRSLAGTGGH